MIVSVIKLSKHVVGGMDLIWVFLNQILLPSFSSNVSRSQGEKKNPRFLAP